MEITRKNILGKTKSQTPLRYAKRLSYRSKGYKLDTSKLLSDDQLVAQVAVGDYICTIEYTGVLATLQQILKTSPVINLQSVIRAVTKSFDNPDVRVMCSCPDFCLHEDTQIKLLNGEVVSIKEMKSMFDNKEELWVYSTDNNGDFKPGKVSNVWISGTTTEYIEVTLDNDRIIRTTPNHLYMLRDGSYIRADELRENMSLMPLYFSYHNGYENVKLNSIKDKTVFKSIYKIVSEELLSEQTNEAKDRSNEDIIQIHHSDFNKLNNYPSNLIPMGKHEHWMYHCSVAMDPQRFEKFRNAGVAYWRSEEGRKQKSIEFSNSIKEYWRNMTPEQRQEKLSDMKKHSFFSNNDMSEFMKNIWSNMSEEEFERRSKIQGEILNNAIKSMSTEERTNFYKQRGKSLSKFYSSNSERALEKKEQVRQLGLMEKSAEHRKHLSESAKKVWSQMSETERSNRMRKLQIGRYKYSLMYIVNNGLDLTEENYMKFKRKSDPLVSTFFDSFDSLLEYFNLTKYNHSVKSIRRVVLDNPEFVYDLEVDNYHNFYVDAGVMLHNCYRHAYTATKFGYKYGDPENRPAKITNPYNRGGVCKHLAALLANKTWMIKVSSEINRFIRSNYDEILDKLGYAHDEVIARSAGRPRMPDDQLKHPRRPKKVTPGLLNNETDTDGGDTNGEFDQT